MAVLMLSRVTRALLKLLVVETVSMVFSCLFA